MIILPAWCIILVFAPAILFTLTMLILTVYAIFVGDFEKEKGECEDFHSMTDEDVLNFKKLRHEYGEAVERENCIEENE